MFNLIRNYCKSCKAIKAILPSEKDKIGEYVTDNNIVVSKYYKPEALELAGTLFGLAINLGGMTTGNKYSIIIDDNFSLLSESTKEFALYHELGHINNGDLVDLSNFFNNIRLLIKQIMYLAKGNKLTIIDNKEIEIAADKYAADHIGVDNAILALKELQSLVSDVDLSSRIIALGGNTTDLLCSQLKNFFFTTTNTMSFEELSNM